MARLVIKNKKIKKTPTIRILQWDGTRLVCVQNKDIIMGSLYNGRAYARERAFILASYNFYISTPILTLETIFFYDSQLLTT